MEEKIKSSKFEGAKTALKNFLKREGVVKRTVLWLIVVLLLVLFVSVVINSFGSDHTYSDATIPESSLHLGEYREYLDKHDQVFPEDVEIIIPGVSATDYTGTGFGVVDYTDEHGQTALKTTGSGSATWTFDVDQAGFYNIILDYFPEEDSGVDIERSVYVNGEVPYDDLLNVVFQRVWADGGDKIVDANLNEIRPTQVEKPMRREAYIQDKIGYVTEPYLFYFEEGENTLTLISVRETMSIFNVHIVSRVSYPTYEEVKAEYAAKGYEPVKGGITAYHHDPAEAKIEGEDADYRSSSTIYAIHDRSSAYNSPAHPVKIILNTIGGSKWSSPGDWITWEINAPEAGLYNISLRSKQSLSRGLFSTRKVYINDELPFAEALNTKFVYSNDWSMVTLGTEDEPFYFYLEEGKNTITLEVTLGDYGSQINRIQQVIDDLNSTYRNIIAKIGINPDKYIDYRLTEEIPEMIPAFEKAIFELEDVARTITEISGEKSSESAILERMAVQLKDFVNNPRKIQRNITSFSNNISSLGTWIITVSEQALSIDYLLVHSDDYELPKANPNFFVGAWYSIRSFFQSFFFDYSSIGVTAADEEDKIVEVWLLTSPDAGREQGNSIRTLIDSSFESDAVIELKVVGPEVLLMATLAGRGPDVALNAVNGIPVNYALRGAVQDLSVFDDFDEVVTRFHDSAMVPFEFEGGYYALPYTQLFPVIFYRTDIFEDKGWPIPDTWEEVVDLIPELQIDNLSFFLPLNTLGAVSIVNQVFASRLFQTGGSFYRTDTNEFGDSYMLSNFDSEESMQAFEFWTEFYTAYSFDLAITGQTFINRFRTGEMPIGINNYNLYNTLMVFAPEIRGKWDFALLPGTRQDDGTINRASAASGSAMIMMEQSEVKEEAWEFMKWWLEEETQTAYNREIESIIGTAARHPTPNVEAFLNYPWTVDELEILTEQWRHTVGIPEVAGGYYTGRNLENAFRRVVNNNLNPRETFEERS